jgi:hypothetical protein
LTLDFSENLGVLRVARIERNVRNLVNAALLNEVLLHSGYLLWGDRSLMVGPLYYGRDKIGVRKGLRGSWETCSWSPR